VGYDGSMGADVLVVLIVVLILVLMWRGPKTLPAWGRSLGRGARAARQEADDIRAEIEKGDTPADK
jgi:Sec-independent protein translocase protein TatA